MGAAKGRVKQRRERVALDVSLPIPVADLGVLGGDDSIEERDDGVKGIGQVSARRVRRPARRAFTVSLLQMLEAAAAWEPDWQRAERIDQLIRHDGPGRRMETNAMTMFVFEQARVECRGSAQAAERELADGDNWKRLCRAVELAYPDRSDRRLHPKPPTYKQYWRFRHQYIEDIDDLRYIKRAEALEVARQVGLFDPALGSMTRPSANNVIYGDSKVLNGMFNTPPIDPHTGLPSERRHDPDMHPYHKGDKRTGRRMVSAMARTDHFGERAMIDVATMHVTDGSDGSVFTDMVLDLPDREGVAVANYDMALHAASHDRLLAAGIVPVTKVARNAKGKPGITVLGPHELKPLSKGLPITENLVAIDGWPGLVIPTTEGPKWVAMELVQAKKAKNKSGDWRVWGVWRVRDLPEVPRQLRGATAHVRHSYSVEDGDRSRSRATRLFPEGSDGYREIYRRRNDVESMHRHLKDLMFNDRVSTIGDRSLRIWLHNYQTRVNRNALIAWHYRTGGDISPWFGNWRPPPQRKPLPAAA